MGKVKGYVLTNPDLSGEAKAKGVLLVDAMQEHFDLIDAERAVFSDKDGVTTLRWFEDLTNIKDEETRTAKIKEVDSVFSKVTERKQAIRQLITQWNPGNGDTGEEAKNQARAFESLMGDHIPEMLRNEVNIKKRVKNVIDNSLMSKEEKRTKIEDLIKHENIDEERRLYIDSFEYGTISEAAQLDPFFDRPFRSISQGTVVDLVETTANMVNRMVKIRDLGGTWKDVERASAHIPEALLPDKIVKDCQGYRKVDRELQYERLIKKYKNEPLTAAKIIDAVNSAATIFAKISGNPLAADGDPKSWAFGDDAYFIFNLVVTETTTVKAEVQILRELKNSESPDICWATMQRITLALNNINSGVASFKSLPQIASFAAANPTSSVADFVGVAGIMGPIGSAISLISAFYDLYKLKGERDQAVSEYDEQRRKFYLGLEGAPDKALYNAIVNEKGAKERQLRKAKVAAAASTLTTAGGFANLSAVGAVAGGALVATGSAIKLGNKIVFACIDWSNANAAKQMIDLARAGSRSARIEVFNKSGFYAKMLLCVLAKEGHEFAYQFIVARGFCEEDLNGPHALYILRSALMKKAGQEDDPESDSAFRGALDFFSKAGRELKRKHATR